jgi:7-carboxy-7-deazaguanine synthase
MGRPAVLCRFSGCNLWSGKEEDRATAACKFCDTDFVDTDGPNGDIYANPAELARKIVSLSCRTEAGRTNLFVVCSGGEPLLQLDAGLLVALHRAGARVAIETNGTLLPPEGVDWVCVSPKAGVEMKLRRGDELKLVFPQEGLSPESVADLDFRYFFLQPMDGPNRAEYTAYALRYCLENPQWRLSLQMHKMLGIP